MIIYDTDSYFGYGQYFGIVGSALVSHRSLPQGILGGVFGYFAVRYQGRIREQVENPSAYFSAISLVLGFLLVFRTQLAYYRYWEGRTAMMQFASKLDDIGVHTMNFVRGDHPEAIMWKSNMGRLLVLYYALALAELREETDLNKILAIVNMRAPKAMLDQLMTRNNDQCYIVACWIVDAWIARAKSGGVVVSDPVQSRTYQIISEAQLAVNQAQKIQTTPFPYPMMQVCGMLLHLYLVTGPMIIGSYLMTYYMGILVSFFSVVGFFGLNKIAEELEYPFGQDPNDLPLDMYLVHLRDNMLALGLLQIPKEVSMWKRGISAAMLASSLGGPGSSEAPDAKAKRLTTVNGRLAMVADGEGGGGGGSEGPRGQALKLHEMDILEELSEHDRPDLAAEHGTFRRRSQIRKSTYVNIKHAVVNLGSSIGDGVGAVANRMSMFVSSDPGVESLEPGSLEAGSLRASATPDGVRSALKKPKERPQLHRGSMSQQVFDWVRSGHAKDAVDGQLSETLASERDLESAGTSSPVKATGANAGMSPEARDSVADVLGNFNMPGEGVEVPASDTLTPPPGTTSSAVTEGYVGSNMPRISRYHQTATPLNAESVWEYQRNKSRGKDSGESGSINSRRRALLSDGGDRGQSSRGSSYRSSNSLSKLRSSLFAPKSRKRIITILT